MSEIILIGVAWPYANGSLHLGQVAGAYLPADIFARYHRLNGDEVLMVSGSDQHGAPITIRAEKESKTPQEIASRYHQQFLQNWRDLGISFDLFTSTGTENHLKVTHDIFLTLWNKGYLRKDVMLQAYCPKCQRFLPDRYVEGTCPYCGFPTARGDGCDECGKPLNPTDLKDPYCVLCSTPPRFEMSEHFFLRLSAFQDELEMWIASQSNWKHNVLGTTRKLLKEGLKDRAITRDMDWGIPVPIEGFNHKCIYVWFEAVIGYLSASKEWAHLQGDDTAWQHFWHGDAKSFYFIGKDNIFFHTLIWPAMLMGYGDLNLPYNVPANEFLTLEGKRLSTSLNWAVWLPDYLERYDPDSLRYALAANMPETGDSDFSWREFLRRNNDELVATYGNLAHRVLTFAFRYFEGVVPSPGELDDQSRDLLDKAGDTIIDVGRSLQACQFRKAIRKIMALAQDANRYIDVQAPWKTIREEPQSAARSTYTVLSVLTTLRTVFSPFLPFSSEKLHTYLGFTGSVSDVGWRLQILPPGQKLHYPKPLFAKLDDSIVVQEESRLNKFSQR
ncbi:MAG: methionine--tRNA ligase [Dehalococcoidia bacterium]|nr:methionine--tRNA ligase [Dehalococcoidia bacterium]